MSRRRVASKRAILPDPNYHSEMLAKFINHLMRDGKKSVAEKVVYGALGQVITKNPKSEVSDEGESGEGTGSGSVGQQKRGLDLLNRALDNIRPNVEVRSRRVGGATYQVPMEVRDERKNALGMRWLIQSARDRGEKGMINRLANEIIDAIAGRGNAVKKREDMHRMAKANQAFAHFRW
jgi:small subunit ribosomal protein S7